MQKARLEISVRAFYCLVASCICKIWAFNNESRWLTTVRITPEPFFASLFTVTGLSNALEP